MSLAITEIISIINITPYKMLFEFSCPDFLRAEVKGQLHRRAVAIAFKQIMAESVMNV